MTIEVELPDGRILEFPAGTPRSVMDREIQGLLSRNTKAVPVGPADEGLQAAKNTLAITGAGATKGGREAANPLSLLSTLARGGQFALPGYQEAARAVGAQPQDIADWAQRNAATADPLQAHKIANPELYKAYTGATGDTIGDSPEMTAEKRGAEMTPTRKGFAAAAEIGAGMLPYLATGPVGAGLKLAGASAALGGVGQVLGGGTGKTIGAMLPMLAGPGIAATRAGWQTGKNIAAPFHERGLQSMADKAILEASGTTPQGLAASFRPPAIQGQPATLGQRTGNRGLLDAEYALHGKGPLVEDSYRATARMAGEEMGALAGKGEREASEALRKALTSTYQREKAMVTPDIERVKQGLKSVEAKGPVLSNHIDGYTANLSQARQKWLADAGLGDLRGLAKGERVALNEVDDVLAAMKAKVRDMPAGSPEKLEVGKFVAHMQEGMEKVVPGMGPAYRQYAQFKGDFDSNKLIGKLFARNTDRTFKIPASEIGDAVRKMPAEAIERAAKLSPGVKQAMRDWVAAAWREKSVTANAAARADDAPSFAKALQFRQENDVLFRAAFSKDDLARADKIVEALRGPTLAEYGQRRFGSPTYNKFVKGTLIEGLVGRVLGNIPGGGMVNQALGSFVYTKPIAELEKKITEALLNPQSTIARLLTTKASPGNVRLLNHYWGATPALAAPRLSAE
jgi:hypothetical protein